jgi:hypothetical protein
VEIYLHSPNTPSWRGAQLKHRVEISVPLSNNKDVVEQYLPQAERIREDSLNNINRSNSKETKK